MKKIITLISLCCNVILAQSEQIEMNYYLEAKPDKVKQLEKGLKDHTDKFHQSAEHLIHTWDLEMLFTGKDLLPHMLRI